jgi:hypothetical protein
MVLTPLYTWSQTPREVVVKVFLSGSIQRSKMDIYATRRFFKLSYGAHLLALDLRHDVDYAQLKATLGPGYSEFVLPKLTTTSAAATSDDEEWTTLLYVGDEDDDDDDDERPAGAMNAAACKKRRAARREASIKVAERESATRDAAALKTKEQAKERSMHAGWHADAESKKTIEQLKAAARTEADDELEAWQREQRAKIARARKSAERAERRRQRRLDGDDDGDSEDDGDDDDDDDGGKMQRDNVGDDIWTRRNNDDDGDDGVDKDDVETPAERTARLEKSRVDDEKARGARRAKAAVRAAAMPAIRRRGARVTGELSETIVVCVCVCVCV